MDESCSSSATPASPLPSAAELVMLAGAVPCVAGRQCAGCSCDGCRAAAAVRLAAEHLEAGRLIEAHLKLGHAAYLFPSLSIVRAQREVHDACLAQVAQAQAAEAPDVA